MPMTMSHCARHSMLLFPKDLAPATFPDNEKPPDATVGGPGTSRVGLH
jgi:hypothetical protein